MRRPIILKLILTVILLLAAAFFYFYLTTKKTAESIKPSYGVSFTKDLSIYLDQDWKDLFTAATKELGFKKIRIGLNWNEIESEPGVFNFSDFDWMMDEAEKRGVKIILVIGRRLIRWPECRIPKWAENLSRNEADTRLLSMLTEATNHFKGRSALLFWQVENEPFFRLFSDCPRISKKLLEREIELVKKLDPSHPVMITDSGEASLWWKSASVKGADILGVSMYRRVWNKYLGFFKYPLAPWTYKMKARLISRAKPKIIISELQMEPWALEGFKNLTSQDESLTVSHEIFEESIEFAKASGFEEIYLWGIEWWYFKRAQGDSFYWDRIKRLLADN